MKGMMYLFPLISVYWAWIMPAAVGVYWIVSSVTSTLQYVIVNKFFSVNHMIALGEARRAVTLELGEAKVKVLPESAQQEIAQRLAAAPQQEKQQKQQKQKQGSKKKKSGSSGSSSDLYGHEEVNRKEGCIMIREAIAKGETVEIAFANACRELGVETTEAEFEILELPQKKTFGLFGGAPARVRAYIEEPDPVPEKEERDPAQEAAAYLKSVLSEMGLPKPRWKSTRWRPARNWFWAAMTLGSSSGTGGKPWTPCSIWPLWWPTMWTAPISASPWTWATTGRERKETLESLGKKMAARAVKTGRNSSLEPMNPYERRIIHTAVQTVAGAKSWSEGVDQGPARGHRAGRRGASPAPGGTTGAAVGMAVAVAAAAAINDRNRRPRNDRPRVNPAPRGGRAQDRRSQHPHLRADRKEIKPDGAALGPPHFSRYRKNLWKEREFNMEKTIAAISTAPAPGGIGMVRISGRRTALCCGGPCVPGGSAAVPFPR